MLSLVALWWLFFFTVVGLCLGSFLNVVIHRLPLGLAINQPRWSFCPDCRRRIAWYDNLPVISYLLLGGRCRSCRAPISPRYLLVELMTAMVVIVLLDAFFIEQARDGLQHAADLNWRISDDWPVFAAHVILMVSLLAMSALDLRFYWVDIRFTHLAALCGAILHTIWTPEHSREWLRPFDATAVAGIAAFIGFAVVWLLLPHEYDEELEQLDHQSSSDPGHSEGSDESPDTGLSERSEESPAEPTSPCAMAQGASEPGAQATTHESPGENSPCLPSELGRVSHECAGSLSASRGAENRPAGRITSVGLPLAMFLFVLVAVAFSALNGGWTVAYPVRASIPLAFFFLVILWESAPVRDSDTEIAEAIASEAPEARRRALGELADLIPGIILGAAALWLMMGDGSVGHHLVDAIHWKPFGGQWQPVWGLGTAVSGYVIAAGIGWAIRIIANLAYGKEAFATGDIHMMAAAGAVAGWQSVLLGFMITCLLAIVAWVLLLPFKKSRVIPLGPWLTMGFLSATLFHKQLIATSVVQHFIAAADLLFLNNSQFPPFG